MKAAAVLCWLVLASALAGCTEGYPEGGATTRRVTAADRVALLQAKLAGNEAQVRSVALPEPCTLRIRWKAGPDTDLALASLDTLVDTDPASGDFVVFLTQAGSDAQPRLLMSTAEWADMTMVRSELNQLRGHCAEASGGGG